MLQGLYKITLNCNHSLVRKEFLKKREAKREQHAIVVSTGVPYSYGNQNNACWLSGHKHFKFSPLESEGVQSGLINFFI